MNYPTHLHLCPHCDEAKGWIKAGKNPSGSQIYKCKSCNRKHTPRPKIKGYAPAVRQQAITLYNRGMSYRSIAQTLEVNHQTVANWVNDYLDL